MSTSQKAPAMAFDFDLIVIGAGSGGVRASRISAGHGARVAVIEESRPAAPASSAAVFRKNC